MGLIRLHMQAKALSGVLFTGLESGVHDDRTKSKSGLDWGLDF